MSMFLQQLRVEQRVFWRNLSSVLFTFLIPIGLLIAVEVSGDSHDALAFMVALAVISTGFQGLSIQLAMHREQGVLKRMMATPLPMTTLVAAKAASVFVVVLLQTAINLVLSIGVFGSPAPQHWLALPVIVIAGTITFVALGFALAALIPNGDAAPAIANAAYLGLLALTGVLANVDAVPDALARIGEYLPLYELIDGVNRAWFGDGGSFARALVVLAAWSVAGVLATSRWFRWEPAGER
jgi:ABC-2 type transport system permease protein